MEITKKKKMNDEIRGEKWKKKKESLTHFRESNPEHGMPGHCVTLRYQENNRVWAVILH